MDKLDKVREQHNMATTVAAIAVECGFWSSEEEEEIFDLVGSSKRLIELEDPDGAMEELMQLHLLFLSALEKRRKI